MTTINDIRDFIRVLDEHPEWLEEVRVRLLSRELLELPEKFAELVALVHTFMGEMYEFRDETNRRLVRIDAEQNTMAATVKRIDTNLSEMKGAFAIDRARRASGVIALHMNLERTADVPEEELWIMTRDNDTSDISDGDMESFHGADVVIQAVDQGGAECYIAVEVSYTANRRDAERAMRNAELLTRFTGKPAYAAGSAVEIDRRIRPLVRSNALSWHKINASLWEKR